MKLTVNGIDIPLVDGKVDAVLDMGGVRADMPKVHIQVNNGEIDASASSLTTSGTIHLHPFRSEP